MGHEGPQAGRGGDLGGDDGEHGIVGPHNAAAAPEGEVGAGQDDARIHDGAGHIRPSLGQHLHGHHASIHNHHVAHLYDSNVVTKVCEADLSQIQPTAIHVSDLYHLNVGTEVCEADPGQIQPTASAFQSHQSNLASSLS